ncbi:MAG: hypothetical protein R3C11_09595 [Planctomycetaceae bacterium]
MNTTNEPSAQKKVRIDLGEDSLNLEKEAGSGIWHVVVKRDEENAQPDQKNLEVAGVRRSRDRELSIDQFKS